jgi:hypothetical protein
VSVLEPGSRAVVFNDTLPCPGLFLRVNRVQLDVGNYKNKICCLLDSFAVICPASTLRSGEVSWCMELKEVERQRIPGRILSDIMRRACLRFSPSLSLFSPCCNMRKAGIAGLRGQQAAQVSVIARAVALTRNN